jgi:hypothetical protein
MAVSVAAVMRHCRNYFEVGYLDGTFRITGNALSADVEGAHYVCISGSLMHDGVWEICNGYLTGRDVAGLEDEEFDGRVWLLAPPIDFLELVKDIREYEEKNPLTNLESEKFGNYSRTFSAQIAGRRWNVAYSASLSPYMRMFTEVR